MRHPLNNWAHPGRRSSPRIPRTEFKNLIVIRLFVHQRACDTGCGRLLHSIQEHASKGDTSFREEEVFSYRGSKQVLTSSLSWIPDSKGSHKMSIHAGRREFTNGNNYSGICSRPSKICWQDGCKEAYKPLTLL